VELSSVPEEARTPDAVNEMSAPYRTTFVGPPLELPHYK